MPPSHSPSRSNPPASPPIHTVKRSKVRQPGRLGQVVLQPEDVLVLSTPPDFDAQSEDFTANFSSITYMRWGAGP